MPENVLKIVTMARSLLLGCLPFLISRVQDILSLAIFSWPGDGEVEVVLKPKT